MESCVSEDGGIGRNLAGFGSVLGADGSEVTLVPEPGSRFLLFTGVLRVRCPPA